MLRLVHVDGSVPRGHAWRRAAVARHQPVARGTCSTYIRSVKPRPAESGWRGGSAASRRAASGHRWRAPRRRCCRRTPARDHRISLGSGSSGSCAISATPTRSASEVMIIISVEDLRAHVADRGPLGPAQAELADAAGSRSARRRRSGRGRPSAAGSRRSCRRPSAECVYSRSLSIAHGVERLDLERPVAGARHARCLTSVSSKAAVVPGREANRRSAPEATPRDPADRSRMR